MTIRRFTTEDILAGEKVRAIAYVQKRDMEARAEAIRAGEGSAENWWGAFTEDGIMAACMADHDYRVWFDGQIVRMGGIGGVATLPEYREHGAIRSMFRPVLDAAYERGEVFSVLYPFSHVFYRKFGYDMFFDAHRYEIEPHALQKFQTNWRIMRVAAGEATARFTALHNAFAKRYNACVFRTDAQTAQENRGDPFSDGVSRFLLEGPDGDAAYLTYHAFRERPDWRVVDVRDFACTTPAGFRAILALLGRLTAEMRSIRIVLPDDLPLASMVDTPHAFRHICDTNAQLRLVNAAQALALLRKPENASFSVAVQDDFMPQNNGTFSVCGHHAARENIQQPDLSIDIRTLGQLCIGALDLNGAMYKPDICVHSNEAVLHSVFRRRSIFLNDSF